FGFGDRVGRLESGVLAAFGVCSCFRQRGERPVFGRAARRAPEHAVRPLDELDSIVLGRRLGVFLPALGSLPLLHARLRYTNFAGRRKPAARAAALAISCGPRRSGTRRARSSRRSRSPARSPSPSPAP